VVIGVVRLFCVVVYAHLCLVSCFFVTTLPPPGSTLFPYTTLFRSLVERAHAVDAVDDAARLVHRDDRGRLVLVDVQAASSTASTDRKSTRLNSSHVKISYAVFCLKKKKCYN